MLELPLKYLHAALQLLRFLQDIAIYVTPFQALSIKKLCKHMLIATVRITSLEKILH